MARTSDPILEFQELFERAKTNETADATRCALATAGASGRPSVRIVLLKDIAPEGLAFYTNLESRKAKDLRENPSAELCFHWPSIDTQVRVSGSVVPVPDDEADAYFASRSRESRIGAWTSKQSQPLQSRKQLLARYVKMQAKFAGRQVPRPSFWGGYRLVPDSMEFWYDQLHRLHDRFLYRKSAGNWTVERLYP